jgi:DNA recombination protein RmuC
MSLWVPLLSIVAGAVVGGLAVALWDSRAASRLRESLARAQAELSASTDAAGRQRETFVALSTEVLQNTQRSFLDLVRPVEASLKQVDEKIRAIEKEREGAYRELKSQVADLRQSNIDLRTETATLATALRAPHTRGRWGEIHLRRVVEMSGMQAHCDFVEQSTIATEAGTLRPDMIVNLPGGKQLIVDAKVPLTAYLEAQETTDDGLRDRKLADHARLVKDHITRLAQKAYWEQLDDTPEFVVLFIPGEAFFSAAAQRDPDLIEYGFARGVVPASPTNLVALLKTVQYAWRQEKVAENAAEIRDLGAELHDRVATMAGHFKALGVGLDGTVRAYNDAMASLTSRVVVSARKMKELGAAGGREIPELAPVERERTPIGSE